MIATSQPDMGSEMYTPGSYSITRVLHVRTYLRSDFIVTKSGTCRTRFLESKKKNNNNNSNVNPTGLISESRNF